MSHLVFASELSTVLRHAIEARKDTLLDQWKESYPTHGQSTVVHAVMGGRDVIVKRFNAATLRSWCKRMAGSDKAVRSWRNAQRLLALGLKTGRPLARMTPDRARLHAVSYLVLEYIPGVRADHYLRSPDVSHERKTRVALRIVEAVWHMHSAGLVHRDLKGKNLLIHEEQPWFIDLDPLRRPVARPVLNHGMAKDRRRLPNLLGPLSGEVLAGLDNNHHVYAEATRQCLLTARAGHC